MSDAPEVTAIMFQPSAPVEALRDASPQTLLNEIYRLQAEVERLKMAYVGLKSKQDEHLALGATVEDHRIQLNDHGERIEGLERSTVRTQESAASIETSVRRMREQNALTYKAQERRDATQRDLGEKLQAKLDRLLDLHQPKVAL